MVGRADYALLGTQGNVVVFLEAKSLGEQLANHRSQVTGYANELGIQYPALTNGSDWEVYDNSLLVPIEQRRVLNVSLAAEDVAKTALQLLLLWRPNLALGEAIAAAEPIVGLQAPVDAEAPAALTAPTAIAATPLPPQLRRCLQHRRHPRQSKLPLIICQSHRTLAGFLWLTLWPIRVISIPQRYASLTLLRGKLQIGTFYCSRWQIG